MDPNANLAEQRRIIARLHRRADGFFDDVEPDIERLAELAAALDEWIVGGGFLPDAWAVGFTLRHAKHEAAEFQAGHHAFMNAAIIPLAGEPMGEDGSLPPRPLRPYQKDLVDAAKATASDKVLVVPRKPTR